MCDIEKRRQGTDFHEIEIGEWGRVSAQNITLIWRLWPEYHVGKKAPSQTAGSGGDVFPPIGWPPQHVACVRFEVHRNYSVHYEIIIMLG